MEMRPPFVPGLELAERFYRDAVRPILDRRFPDLPHSAALLGYGSEVLGYDTERSTDHNWGPRVRLFLGPEDFDRLAAAIGDTLAQELPRAFLGYSTHVEDGIHLAPAPEGPIRHRVELFTLAQFFHSHLGFDPRTGIAATDWLTVSSQRLLEVTAGAVFHDGLGELLPAREHLAWYPHDLWCYLLACGWGRIAQEEAFVGRTGEVGDDLGSRVVAARLVRDLMRLCFLIERRYAPYSKWLGTAFSRLTCAADLTPVLHGVLKAGNWQDREMGLSRAYTLVAEMFNALKLAAPLDPAPRLYYDRPFHVLGAERFVSACLDAIDDPSLRSLPHVGSVDQFVDSTDLLTAPEVSRRLAALYE